MTVWYQVCAVDDILPNTGVSALIGRRQVALFRVDGRVFALDNRDPFCGTPVLARGIVGDRDGVLKVASPMYKQSFALATGVCLDDDTVAVTSFPVRVAAGIVEIEIAEIAAAQHPAPAPVTDARQWRHAG